MPVIRILPHAELCPEGRSIKRFGPRDEPASLVGDIERALPRGS